MKPDVSPTNETASADHFCSLTKMIPLTPEQIKSMDWHRVWISYDDQKGDGEWGIVLFGKVYSTDTLDGVGLEDLLNDVCPNSMDMNEQTYRVFGKPPTHIQPEAWDTCDMCGGERKLYQHTNTTKLFMNTFGKAATLVTECVACPPYADCCMKGISANSAFKINFCPECGRPLTEKAWVELEKRLMGFMN